MKRYGQLWASVIAFENLLNASRQAQRGKRFSRNVLAFNYNLEAELHQLQQELTSQTYCPGTYTTFEIQDPKPRLISAAPYRDRVVHHALCNVIVPLIEPTLIHDTYANRIGYGTHRALDRFISFARTSRYILQCDIRKYFPSVDHEILKTILRRKIKCPQTLWLIGWQYLADARLAIEDYLATLRLVIHPIKSQLFETQYGANFVGFRILPDRIRVRNDNLRRSRHRLRQLQQEYASGFASLDNLIQRLQSWEAHLFHGNTHGLRRAIFDSWIFSRDDDCRNLIFRKSEKFSRPEGEIEYAEPGAGR